ncbi:GNAT family N-acetyltransferase [Natronoarchaeum mannanilyticum]|uniref:GNAT family N-acetyltransferase n=1 Tax=Natronoarchaeum mannanilyticum TaxID=926360 RepID=A0AAV3T6L9_9EURY
MSDRIYPDEAASGFPEPPVEFEDREGRTIEVRAYESGDEEALVEMYDAFDPADRAQGIPPSTEERIRDWLELIVDEGHNVIAWHDDAVAGHATLVPDGAEAYELAIFVTQEYQRAGIGGRLIRALLGYGASQDVQHVWLTVERWNRAAVALYEDVGFERSGTESFELEMSLRLD